MTNFTKTQFFTAIATGIMADGMTENDIKVFAEHEIELLANRAAKAKETRARKAAEPDTLVDAIMAVLTSEFQTAADIAAALNDEKATVSKVSYRLNALAESGVVIKDDIKIEGQRSTRKGYRVA